MSCQIVGWCRDARAAWHAELPETDPAHVTSLRHLPLRMSADRPQRRDSISADRAAARARHDREDLLRRRAAGRLRKSIIAEEVGSRASCRFPPRGGACSGDNGGYKVGPLALCCQNCDGVPSPLADAEAAAGSSDYAGRSVIQRCDGLSLDARRIAAARRRASRDRCATISRLRPAGAGERANKASAA